MRRCKSFFIEGLGSAYRCTRHGPHRWHLDANGNEWRR